MGVSEVCIEKANDNYWRICQKAKIIKTTETMIFVSCDKKFCLRKITAAAGAFILHKKYKGDKIRQQANAGRTS